VAIVKAKAEQLDPTVTATGDDGYLAMSKIGQLFTADWKTRLVLAGKVYRMSVGTLSGDAGMTRVTGGGAGTTIDLDEPEMVISVQAGHFLVPIEILVSSLQDQDANADLGEIIACVDVSAGVTTGGTAGTAYNLLDGGPAFPGYFGHTVTSAITNPVNEHLLAAVTANASEFVSNGAASNLTNGVITNLTLHYEPSFPQFFAGPCQLCVYWGGTTAATAIASVVVAAVPSSWVPVS
jgi:hypothetical protein